MKKYHLYIRIPEKLKKHLEQKSKELGVSQQAIVIMALDNFLKNDKSISKVKGWG